MTLLGEHETPPPTDRRWQYGAIALVLLAGAGYFLTSPGTTPEPVAPVRPVEPVVAPAPAPVTPEPDTRRAETLPTPTPARDPAPRAEPAPPPPPPSQIVLRVTSDIDGADVFVDRQYLGTTPFESSAVAPGRHKVNVSATGYESHAEDVEITNDVTTITVTFKTVRLDQRVAVIHKHRFGDCQGQLVASTDGIRYQTEDDDGFEVALDSLERFVVDYLEHTLQIKVRDGRTYNFTDRQENADDLFVFHREVEKARKRLARGDRRRFHRHAPAARLAHLALPRPGRRRGRLLARQ